LQAEVVGHLRYLWDQQLLVAVTLLYQEQVLVLLLIQAVEAVAVTVAAQAVQDLLLLDTLILSN
jgi:hypothetical protein